MSMIDRGIQFVLGRSGSGKTHHCLEAIRGELRREPMGGALILLVPEQAIWRYLDDGSDQGTAWRAPGFDDSTWAQGAAELGYGDGDESTVVSF